MSKKFVTLFLVIKKNVTQKKKTIKNELISIQQQLKREKVGQLVASRKCHSCLGKFKKNRHINETLANVEFHIFYQFSPYKSSFKLGPPSLSPNKSKC